MIRYLSNFIEKDLQKKVVLLTGPRQVGKTWLSKSLFHLNEYVYLNYDRAEDRQIMVRASWRRDVKLVVLDELHKMRQWKSWLKGIYDTEGVIPALLVTGSARLDAFKRGGRESLAGRHFLMRLHPLSVRELIQDTTAEEAFARLMRRGGFPEPYLADTDDDADRWRLSHVDRVLREDMRDLSQISDVTAVEYLVQRLAQQVGSVVSYKSIADDLNVAATTVKRWIDALEALYIVFAVRPYSKKIKGAILKQPKYYFYDVGRIPVEQQSARFENLVALHLLKEIHYREDIKGKRGQLNFIRNKQGHEIDFLVQSEGKKPKLVECKLSEDEKLNFHRFEHAVPGSEKILLVMNTRHEEDRRDYRIRRAANWLAELEA